MAGVYNSDANPITFSSNASGASFAGPINTWTEYHIDKWNKEQAVKAAKRRTSTKKSKQPEQPLLYIQNRGLTPYDWDIINNYIRILMPLREATLKFEARGKASYYRAIWQIILTFN